MFSNEPTRKGDKVNKLFLLVLLCLPLSAFAHDPFEINVSGVAHDSDVYNCAVCYQPVINTEIADSTTVSGGDTQTNKVTSTAKHLKTDPTDVLMVISSEEVGWQNS